MKVLLVSQYFWPEHFRVNDLALELKKEGHEVEILTSIPNYPEGKIYDEFKKNPKKFDYYHGIKVIRVKQITRGQSQPFRLFINYLSFLFFGFVKSFFLKKKYDVIITFATSPILVALISIIICKLKNSKHVIWVQDLWPDVLFDLKIIKNKKTIIYSFLNFIVKYIYKNSDSILCQSLQYKKIISNLSDNIKKKCIYFPSWSEQKFNDINFVSKKNLKTNILFTGNIGESQNFELILNVIKIANKNIEWHIVGEGRFYKELKYQKNKNNLLNLHLHGLKKYNELGKYIQQADILLISLKKGKAFESTIPGKFSTYLNYNKFILGLIGGETKTMINKYNLGFATDEQNPEKVKIKLEEIIKQNININQENYKFLRKIFSKKLSINKLNKILYNLKNQNKTKIIKSVKDLSFKKNMILSALNLAFLGFFAKGDLKLTKEYLLWPDGFFANQFNKEIKKIPGRDLLQNIILDKDIKKIIVFGNLTKKGYEFLKEKFKIIIEHNPLPYGEVESFKKYIPKLKVDELVILTLPTPKQEMFANLIAEKNISFKILCIGGALSMISDEEKAIPKKFDIFFFSETLWRLQYDTLRRTKRLLTTLTYYYYGRIFKIFKDLKIEIADEK